VSAAATCCLAKETKSPSPQIGFRQAKDLSANRTGYLPKLNRFAYNHRNFEKAGFPTLLPLDKRRDTIQIAKEILGLLRLGTVGKTEVMYGARLSYGQTQKYLPWLIGLGLIEEAAEDCGQNRYQITGKGLGLLTEIENLQEMLKPAKERELQQMPEYRAHDNFYRRTLGHLARVFGAYKGNL
jgi:predicted transcriptional regulator